LWKQLWGGGKELPVPEDELWVRAVDRATGEAVRFVPRSGRMFWGDDLRREAAARVVMQLGLAAVVPVLHAGPGVVYAEAPEAGWPRLSLTDAAACTISACEAAESLLAAGVDRELHVGPWLLRVLGGGEVAWVVPGVTSLAAVEAHSPGFDYAGREAHERAVAGVFGARPRTWDWRDDAVARVVWELAGMFFVLAGEEALVAEERLAALAQVYLGKDSGLCVAELAALLVPLTAAPELWAERIIKMPHVRVVPRLVMDWGLIVADGEALMAEPAEDSFSARHPQYVTIPLAEAYHQRACIAVNNGEVESALVEATRAVQWDPTVSHRATRAVILDALGRLAEARAEIDAAFMTPPLVEAEDWYHGPLAPAEEARVVATRGAIALRAGDLAQAEADLRRAWEIEATAARISAYGAVLYALGRIEEAAKVEAMAVAAAPEDAGVRWALVVSLVRLGLAAEAQGHARELLRLAPGVYDERVGRVLALR
jgi:tetratricopeptide (TPR) repeat protein